MKKKILLTALLAVMVVSMSMFVGCFKGWNDGARIAFAERPRETFYVGETGAKLTFKLKDLNTNEVIEFDGVNGKNGITVTNFSVATVGQRTATIKYGNYTLSFTYNVVEEEKMFAGGDGGQYNPYQIATEEQFLNMLKNGVRLGYNYYKLTSNLDFSNKTLVQPMYYDHGYVNGGQSTYFEAVIDGDDHEVTGLNAITDEKGNKNSKRMELFGLVGRFTLKNITFEFNATSANCVSGLVTSGIDNKEVLFENVTTKGEIDCNNFANTSTAVFMAQASRGTPAHNVTFKNCTNKTDIKNSVSQKFVAAFTNTQKSECKVTFIDCVNEGNIQGAMTACSAFVNLYNFSSAKNVSFTNCENKGEIIKTVAKEEAANAFVSFSFNKADQTADSYAVPEGCKTVALNESLKVMSLTVNDDLSMTLTGAPENVAYYKVVCQGGINYLNEKVSGGIFTFYQRFTKDEFAAAKLLKIAYADEIGVAGEYGNAYVTRLSDHLVYCEKTLARGIDMSKDKTSIAVYAFDAEDNILGCSNVVTGKILDYVA